MKEKEKQWMDLLDREMVRRDAQFRQLMAVIEKWGPPSDGM